MHVGHVSQAWLYPVKSMAGSRVDSFELDALGAIGDRSWAMLDATSGDIAWGKRFPKLMHLSARYIGDRPASRVFGDAVPAVSIRLPNGREVRSDMEPDGPISSYAGAELRLRPLQPPEDREHYRWSEPRDEATLMKILGIGPGEDPPDFSVYDEDLLALKAEYYSTPGTYTDMAPIHALTTASLEHMTAVAGVDFDLRRFRPNLLIETVPELQGLAEEAWVGKRLHVGEAVLTVDAKAIRCSMPARPQEPYGIEADPTIAKSLYRETGRFLGAYLSVERPGRISSGDAVELADR